MKDFFVKQWNNFKKNWYWYLIFFSISIFDVFSLKFFVNNLFYYIVGDAFDLKFVYYDYTAIYALISFFMFKYLCDLELYIFSYYIYTGNNNWYKFFSEREKLHKKEDREAYKQYLKNKKEEN